MICLQASLTLLAELYRGQAAAQQPCSYRTPSGWRRRRRVWLGGYVIFPLTEWQKLGLE